MTLSEDERAVMEHALGINSRNKVGYRNHFCASPGHHDWDTLVALREKGMMIVSRAPCDMAGGDYTFSVTEHGRREVQRWKP